MSLASSLPSSSARLSPGPGRHDNDEHSLANLDPALHPSGGSPNHPNANRLADFAGHILGAPDTFTSLMDEQRGGEMSSHDGVEHSRALDLLSFANDDPSLGGRQGQHGERAFGELLEAAQADSGDPNQQQLDALGQGPPPPPAGQGRKRKRPGQNGEDMDDMDDMSSTKNKKESHVRVRAWALSDKDRKKSSVVVARTSTKAST